jgi:tetratricopeptide (TPR) repeat protein
MLGVSVRLLVRSSFLFIAWFGPVFSHAADAPKSDSPKPGEPTDPKARKTYREALDWLRERRPEAAIESFRKAARQDGHCSECLHQAYTLAIKTGEYKEAEDIAREWLAIGTSDLERATAHYRIAVALQGQGINNKKDKCFDESCNEFKTALQMEPKLQGSILL